MLNHFEDIWKKRMLKVKSKLWLKKISTAHSNMSLSRVGLGSCKGVYVFESDDECGW